MDDNGTSPVSLRSSSFFLFELISLQSYVRSLDLGSIATSVDLTRIGI